MSVKKQVKENSKKIEISIDGRFDFSLHQHFRDAYVNCKENGQVFTLNLSTTSYMDSSALGMLLLLRDHAGGNTASIKILNCSPDVKKILTISNFEQLFTIQ